MSIYKNLSGVSRIESYEIGPDFIKVRFDRVTKSGCNTYVYTYYKTGRENIDHMKLLAEKGSGLGGFISSNSSNIKDEYESRSYTAASL